MHPYLTDKAVKQMEAKFKRDRRVWEILDLIVTEWETDPLSVQCFDLLLVNEAKELIKQHKKYPNLI